MGSVARDAAGSEELVPVRAYVKAGAIPPAGIGAYGVVSFHAKATPETLARLVRVCEAYKAYLPPQRSLPASVTLSEQMLTIWPLDDPEAGPAMADDCGFVVAHYDLYGGLSAIADAARQGAKLSGEGPFLIGWSPSNTRAVPDKLVLVVDLSNLDSQDSINSAFQFWQQKVVQDPTLWRHGFSTERFRLSVRDFVDRYGEELVSVFNLTKGDSR